MKLQRNQSVPIYRSLLASLLASLFLHMPAWAQDDSLFQQLGGREGIEKVVESLLPLLQNDARIKHQFADTNMDLLGRQLSSQICQLSGGPCRYNGDDMKLVHKNMKIDQAQFNALAEDLQTAMEAHGIPASAQNKLIAKLAPMQRDIVSK